MDIKKIIGVVISVVIFLALLPIINMVITDQECEVCEICEIGENEAILLMSGSYPYLLIDEKYVQWTYLDYDSIDTSQDLIDYIVSLTYLEEDYNSTWTIINITIYDYDSEISGFTYTLSQFLALTYSELDFEYMIITTDDL